MGVYEIVPNISEGRDLGLIDDAVRSAESAGGRVLHRTSDPVHHRSVLTIAGSAREVLDASIALAGVVAERIDLRAHSGVHPRIGALDVLPFVPLCDASMDEAIRLAHEAGARIWERYRIPCFFYERAARGSERRLLANVRRGGFEGLRARFEDPLWKPDCGDIAMHPRAGAIAIGARPILVAFNIELDTGDLAIARAIARQLRERDGGLRTLRALGLRISDDLVQVSLNITDYHATPVHRIVELVERLARARGTRILCCEPIGLLPREAVAAAAHYYLGVPIGPLAPESISTS